MRANPVGHKLAHILNLFSKEDQPHRSVRWYTKKHTSGDNAANICLVLSTAYTHQKSTLDHKISYEVMDQ